MTSRSLELEAARKAKTSDYLKHRAELDARKIALKPSSKDTLGKLYPGLHANKRLLEEGEIRDEWPREPLREKARKETNRKVVTGGIDLGYHGRKQTRLLNEKRPSIANTLQTGHNERKRKAPETELLPSKRTNTSQTGHNERNRKSPEVGLLHSKRAKLEPTINKYSKKDDKLAVKPPSRPRQNELSGRLQELRERAEEKKREKEEEASRPRKSLKRKAEDQSSIPPKRGKIPSAVGAKKASTRTTSGQAKNPELQAPSKYKYTGETGLRTEPTVHTAPTAASAEQETKPKAETSRETQPFAPEAKSSADSQEVQPCQGEPAGLTNYKFACFGNAAVQMLDSIPELVEHFQEKAADILSGPDEFASKHSEKLEQPGQKELKAFLSLRQELRKLLSKEEVVSIGPYLGELFAKMASVKGSQVSASSFMFLQACGVHIKEKYALGREVPYDGNTQQECSAFLDSLLRVLLREESETMAFDNEAKAMLRDSTGLSVTKILECSACHFRKLREEPEEPLLQVDLPVQDDVLPFQACMDNHRKEETIEWQCSACKKNTATQIFQITKASKYVFVTVNRISPTHGNMKNKSPIAFPSGPVQLRVGDDVIDYQALAVTEHLGDRTDRGHYVCTRLVDGRWYLCDDDEVTLLSEEELAKRQGALLVLLRRKS